MHRTPGIFRSYWIAGYEGADHINGRQLAQSMNDANRHHQKIDADYALLKQFHMYTVRESVGWRITEVNGQFDWGVLETKAEAAQKHHIQVLWTLMHYGWPEEIDPFGPKFVSRFARYCEAVAKKLKAFDVGVPFYQPVNEISFLSWAMTSTGLMHPYRGNLGHRSDELKRQLVQAALRGAEAIWSVDPRARIIHTDPVIHIVPPANATPQQREAAARHNASAFQSWDMLCGNLEPGLGGSRKHLDMIGVNYYHQNQWVHETGEPLHWHLRDDRRMPFSDLLAQVWKRYERPLFIAETSHVGAGRAEWLDDIAAEVLACESRGVPIEGICLYPIVDRPDWENPQHWHNSGLWDVHNVTAPSADSILTSAKVITEQAGAVTAAATPYQRVLQDDYAQRLHYWQAYLPVNAHSRAELSPTHTLPHLTSYGVESMSAIIVFSHLRWNFVYQRPQHLLSRMANDYRIIFVEEPVYEAYDDYLERTTPSMNIEVLRPHLTGSAQGFDDACMTPLRAMLSEFLASQALKPYWLWFYTPLALPLAEGLEAEGIVYDCMDELSAFKGASPLMLAREEALFQVADVVFTGGPSLYQCKRHKHPNVYCFASSVDVAHFAPQSQASVAAESVTTASSFAASTSTYAAARSPSALQPRVGYFGVIDERIDFDLIANMAQAHPDWLIIMVGPVVKVDPHHLPQADNIQWLGQQPYEALPQLVAQWDVCMMPFALNASTRFISPTKTLEYMAAERAIVSTAITDVAEPYGHVVPIATTHQDFINQCELLLNETSAQRQQRIETMRDIVSKTSWDKTALSMQKILAAHQARAQAHRNPNVLTFSAGTQQHHSTAYTHPAHVAVTSSDAGAAASAQGSVPRATPVLERSAAHAGKESKVLSAGRPGFNTIILGAGPTGLSAAYHLGDDCLLLEKNDHVGGWCRSIQDKGFTFDYAGHIMFSNDAYVLELYELLLGDNIHWQNREAWIYSKQVYTRYPFQGALYGLPVNVLTECVMGAIEARMEALAMEQLASMSANKQVRAVNAAPRNFEEFIYKVWGAGVAKHFAIPYNKKLWTVPLHEIETSWLGNRVPMPDLKEMIEGALQPVAKPMGPNARFGYPLKGGFQALMNGFLPYVQHKLELNAEVRAVSPGKKTVTLADGRQYHYTQLISTLPLPKLVEACGNEAPPAIQNAAKSLRHVSVKCVNLGIGRVNITDKHWIYYPEETLFHRIFVQGNASPHANAPGGFALTCEITYSDYKPLAENDTALIQRCIDDCIQVGMLEPNDVIITANVVDMPYAYVVYDHQRASNVALIRDWLLDADILLSGRYSEWEYYNSDHAFIAGKKAAERVQARQQTKNLVTS